MAASLGYAPRSRCPTSTCAVAPPSCAPAPLKEAYYLGALMPLFYQPYNGGEGASVPVLLLLATARLAEGLRLGVRFYPPGLTFTAPACLTVCLSLLRTVPQGAKLALRWATSEVQPEYAGGMVLVFGVFGVAFLLAAGAALLLPEHAGLALES